MPNRGFSSFSFMIYVNVVVDQASIFTDQLFTYQWSGEALAVGTKVMVPFGKGDTLRVAYVVKVLRDCPEELKAIKAVDRVEEVGCLSQEMIHTALWMKQRYACKYIEGLRLFLPAGKPPRRGLRKAPYEDLVVEEETSLIQANEEQQQAIDTITEAVTKETREIFLLHGITGSGKTEVYLQTVAETLEQGKTALVLVPEIALTNQLIYRFMQRLGKANLALLHSRLTPGQRHDQWRKIRNKEVKVVIGARSAVFAPLEHIGLVILDEEHESTYKSDQSPKYETLEMALKRARAYGGSVVLGSATPSVVSYYRSEVGIYKRLTLSQRYNQVPLPRVDIVDMKKELRKGNPHPLSQPLVSAMEETLEEGKQVILLLNRRGYFPYVLCNHCGHVFHCPHCEISLTYHKSNHRLCCHYCGYQEVSPTSCPHCGEEVIAYEGIGTERLEEWLEQHFPQVPLDRLDLDTSKQKGAVDRILSRFEKKETRILLGTQLVAKGLDFKDVGLVGIVSGDTGLYFPDFRSTERTFQLIMQAAGRAGRGREKGRVIVQTHSPDHYAILAGSHQDYWEFYQQEIQLRKWGNYPPYRDILQLVFSGKSENILIETVKKWEGLLKREIGRASERLIGGPIRAPGQSRDFRMALIIKSTREHRAAYMKIIGMIKEEEKKSRGKYRMVVDINPYSLWRN